MFVWSFILLNIYQFYLYLIILFILIECLFQYGFFNFDFLLVYFGWKQNFRDNCSFVINNMVGSGLVKKMKVVVKGGVVVDLELGSG